MHYLLFYDVVDDYVERRGAFRGLHLAHAQRARDRGELVLGGALADPVDGAVLLFTGSSPQVAGTFAAEESFGVEWPVQRRPGPHLTTVGGERAGLPG